MEETQWEQHQTKPYNKLQKWQETQADLLLKLSKKQHNILVELSKKLLHNKCVARPMVLEFEHKQLESE